MTVLDWIGLGIYCAGICGMVSSLIGMIREKDELKRLMISNKMSMSGLVNAINYQIL